MTWWKSVWHWSRRQAWLWLNPTAQLRLIGRCLLLQSVPSSAFVLVKWACSSSFPFLSSLAVLLRWCYTIYIRSSMRMRHRLHAFKFRDRFLQSFTDTADINAAEIATDVEEVLKQNYITLMGVENTFRRFLILLHLFSPFTWDRDPPGFRKYSIL